jgi:hypothetical protein
MRRFVSAFFWIAVVVAVVLAGYFWVEKAYPLEGFATAKTLEDEITDIYLEILMRQPTGTELIDHVRRIQRGTMTLEGLRERLIESDEYERMMKTQSNQLAPELDRMLSDRSIVEKLSRIYREERGKAIPEKMIQPLKDIYIELDYNEFAFRAFLRDSAYEDFEADVLRMLTPTRADVLALFEKRFNKEAIIAEGARLKKEYDALKANAGASSSGSGGSPVAANEAGDARCIGDLDSDSKDMLSSIQQMCANLFDKDLEAQCLDKNAKSIILTHHGDMVLRPEYEWSVPQQRPPVCTTLGQKPLIQPVMVNSSLLLGTPLEDAADTQVGSIMPKFKYTEYITVGADQLPKCAGGTGGAGGNDTAGLPKCADADKK